MAKDIFIKPTETELEILQILWQKEKASVREVNDEMVKTKEIGYTTTLKLMQIMHKKGLLEREKFSKQHIYIPLLNQQVVQKHLTQKMLHTLYNGSTSNMVLQLLGNQNTSKEELKEIELFLKNKI